MAASQKRGRQDESEPYQDRSVRPRQAQVICTATKFAKWRLQCKLDVQQERDILLSHGASCRAEDDQLFSRFASSIRGAADLQLLQLRAKEWGMDIPCRGTLMTSFFNAPNSCATAMLYSKYHDIEDAKLKPVEAQRLMQRYAEFLIIKVIEFWLVEAANSRDLQKLLQQPKLDLWEYLRSHVDNIVQSVPKDWQVNVDDIVHKIATQKLSSRICGLLEAVQPWEIVLRSFQEEFNTRDILYMTKLDDITARSHLIGKWIRAQRHAMKSLSCLAVVGLDQTLQMQVQDTLSGMVNHIEDKQGFWIFKRKSMITLSHPTELGNKCAWNLIDGLEHVDPSMTILAPNQCYDAYTKALPKLQDLLESPSVDTSHTKKKDKKGEWGPTLVKIAGVTAMSLWNPAYAAGYLVLNTVVDQYLN